MVPPVGHDARLDLLIQTFLHGVNVLKLVDLTLQVGSFLTGAGTLERVGFVSREKPFFLLLDFCHRH